ncbi:MAG TPA: immunoglobulin domain-containing protein [Fibrobacteria bacterium]|nr:immunoglobulin domain-containing protein [Fibrobacteria bacterium]
MSLSLALTGCLTDDKNKEESGPTISSSPSDVTVDAGQTATFTVIASGSGTLAYQWMKDGANIGGATASSYATVAGSGDDGAEFKCKVTDSDGSTTSSGGFLRIRVTEQTVTLAAQDNALVASSLDLDTWTAYTSANASAHASEIDLVFAYSTVGDSSALYSPDAAKNGVNGSGGFDFMQSWSTANTTEMRVVSVANWSTVTTAASIKALYDAGTAPSPAGRVFVRAGTTIVARSNGSLYVLLRVDAVVQTSSGTVNLTGKAKR